MFHNLHIYDIRANFDHKNDRELKKEFSRFLFANITLLTISLKVKWNETIGQITLKNVHHFLLRIKCSLNVILKQNHHKKEILFYFYFFLLTTVNRSREKNKMNKIIIFDLVHI